MRRDLFRLSEVQEGFESWGRSDDRLSEGAEVGVGGIGFLWRKNVLATPIEGIKSDRIGGLRFEVGEGCVVSVIGVYLPCLDQGIDVYR